MNDRLLGAVCLVISIAMGWAAWGYVAPISYEPVGPRSFPLLLAALMFGAGVLLLTAKVSATSPPFSWSQAKGFLAAAAGILIYSVLFQVLGFVLATTLMTIPVARAFGGNLRQGIVAGLTLGFGLFLLFDRLLDVVLPMGPFSFLFQ